MNLGRTRPRAQLALGKSREAGARVGVGVGGGLSPTAATRSKPLGARRK